MWITCWAGGPSADCQVGTRDWQLDNYETSPQSSPVDCATGENTMFQTRNSSVQIACNRGGSGCGSGFVAATWHCLLIAALAIGSAQAQEYTFSTVAGGFTGDGGAATEAVV